MIASGAARGWVYVQGGQGAVWGGVWGVAFEGDDVGGCVTDRFIYFLVAICPLGAAIIGRRVRSCQGGAIVLDVVALGLADGSWGLGQFQ